MCAGEFGCALGFGAVADLRVSLWTSGCVGDVRWYLPVHFCPCQAGVSHTSAVHHASCIVHRAVTVAPSGMLAMHPSWPCFLVCVAHTEERSTGDPGSRPPPAAVVGQRDVRVQGQEFRVVVEELGHQHRSLLPPTGPVALAEDDVTEPSMPLGALSSSPRVRRVTPAGSSGN